MGIVVDAISDVYTLTSEDMKEPPDVGSTIGREYIHALVNIEHDEKEKMVILLDIEQLLALNDVSHLMN